MASLPLHPMTCTCDRCPRAADDDGFAMCVGIVSGLATGGIMVALIECAVPVSHFITRIFS